MPKTSSIVSWQIMSLYPQQPGSPLLAPLLPMVWPCSVSGSAPSHSKCQNAPSFSEPWWGWGGDVVWCSFEERLEKSRGDSCPGATGKGCPVLQEGMEGKKRGSWCRVLPHAKVATTMGWYCPEIDLLPREVDEGNKRIFSPWWWVSSQREPVGLIWRWTWE